MRRTVLVSTVIALVVGSISAASAVSGISVSDALSGDFSAETSADSGQESIPTTDSSDEPHEHATHDHTGHDHSTHENPSTPGHDSTPAAHNTPAVDHLPENDHARGLVFNGLRPGAQDGPCAGSFEMELPNGKVLCSHGPDPAPKGRDVRNERSVGELKKATRQLPIQANARARSDEAAAEAGSGTAAAAVSGVPCIGDGVSGNRVQAIYAVPADRADRFTEIAPLIEQWAAYMDDMTAASAAATGGERHIRFVTNPDCTLDIEKVVLSSAGDDNLNNTITEMRNLGYDSPSRKYLIWMDANIYCGIAQIYSDDKPTSDNYNNGRFTMFARTDAGCWGLADSAELHELAHNLGSVQPSAPNASAGFHCTDEYDVMCYKDGADVTMSYPCPAEHSGHLDCGHDDYFHTSPPAGSYLDTHWNTANSSFLQRGPVGDPPPPSPNEAPMVDAGPDIAVPPATAAALAGVVDDDGMPNGTLTSSWTKASGPGEVTFADAAAPATEATFDTAGVYILELTADDGELSTVDTVTVTVEAETTPPPPPPPGEVTDVFEASINKRHPVRSHEVATADGAVTATLTFVKKGKGARTAEMTLTAYDASGNMMAAATGVNPVELSLELPAGVYMFEVTGARGSYILEVTHMTV